MHISLSHWISKNPITIHHLHQLLLKYFSTIYFDWFSYCNHHLQRFSHEPPLNMDCPMKPFIYRKKTSTTSIFRNFPNLKTFHFYRCSHVERFSQKINDFPMIPQRIPRHQLRSPRPTELRRRHLGATQLGTVQDASGEDGVILGALYGDLIGDSLRKPWENGGKP